VGKGHERDLEEVTREAVDYSGGLRSVDPEVTWQTYSHLIGDVVGVVPEVRQTGDATLRVFTAGLNVAAIDDLMVLKSRLRAGAGGKGITLAGARAGALAEALERDSMRARGDEPHVKARMADLDRAIHPNDIQLFSERQLTRAAQLLALGVEDPAASGFHRVPAPFDVDAVRDWSQVADLRTGEQAWVPSSLVYLGWAGVPAGYPLGCSNGAAAGNTVKEALLQGLLELVERDSVALWWHPRCHRPAIDLAAWDDPRIEAALAPQRLLGTEVWVLDVTTDLGVPSAAAISTGFDAFGSAALMGFGAHLDPAIAVVRALTELAQMQAPLTAMPAGTKLEFTGHAEEQWFSNVTPESEPWLAPHSSVAPQDAPRHETIDDALDDLIERLTGKGLDVLWADLTRADVGLPVVRTFVPGLRHFWKRTGPGRIFDVPPRLGWREPGYGEDDLNPWAMIL
jgi:ribosomal protein S12 methylthiotransferase accessory factor